MHIYCVMSCSTLLSIISSLIAALLGNVHSAGLNMSEDGVNPKAPPPRPDELRKSHAVNSINIVIYT